MTPATHHVANAEGCTAARSSESGRFVTFCGGAAIVGQRMQPDPRRTGSSVKKVRETDKGI